MADQLGGMLVTTHRTRPEHAAVYRWVRLPSGIEVTALPLLDASAGATDGLFARLTYADALVVAEREGARLISPDTLAELGEVGLQLYPYLGTPIAETTLEHSRLHDEAVFRQLSMFGYDGLGPVAGAGKHWIAGAPAGRSRLGGWDKDGPGPGKLLWQPVAVAHNRHHHDDGTTTMLERGQRDAKTDTPPESEPPDTIPTGEPHIITTAEWGARPAPRRSLKPATGIVLHHMASRNRAPRVDPEAELRVSKYLARACQIDHASRGWGDTGQHFTVSRGGVILEGRLGTLEAARRGMVVHGAHAGPAANSDHWGIECEGTYHLEMVMTEAQWDALVQLVRWLLSVGEISVDSITPHNRWKPTGCPGLLVDRLPELRAAARGEP